MSNAGRGQAPAVVRLAFIVGRLSWFENILHHGKRCGKRECEDIIKEKVGVTSRCMPFDEQGKTGKCVCCGEPADKLVYWGKQY